VLLVDGLPADAESVGDLLPRPAALSGVVDLEHLEPLGEVAQGADRAETDVGVAAGGIAGEFGSFGHDVNRS